MNNTKSIVIGALLAVMAAVFQMIPVFLSEVLDILTVFSALPIFIAAKISPRVGIMSYFAAAMVVMLISMHQGIIFMFTNGVVGVSLGISSYYINKKAVIWFISSLTLTIALIIVKYFIGIPVLGINIPGPVMVQAAVLFIFSVGYSIIYYYFSGFVFKLLKRHLPVYNR